MTDDIEIDADIIGSTNRHKQSLRDIIGLSLEDAKKIFREKYPKFRLHTAWIDGVDQYTQKDLDFNRLNVGVVNGVIVNEYGVKYNDDGTMKSFKIALWG